MNTTTFLKKNLPDSFKKSKTIKNEYSIEKNKVVISIALETSDFLTGEDMFVFIVTVGIKNQFWEFTSDECYHSVFDASFKDNDVILLERWDKINHWEMTDLEALKRALDTLVLPWVNWFLQPEIVTQYLIALSKINDGACSDEEIKMFGSLLTDKAIYPPRTNKLFSSVIATIFEAIGEKEKAIEFLKKHKDFLIQDNKNCKVQSINPAIENEIKLVENGLLKLKKGVS